jgi:histidinol-phosphate aminotransferase
LVTVATPALVENEPYTPGLSADCVAQKFNIAVADVAKLGSAENPYGPSPKAREAVEKGKATLSLYPDWTSQALRAAVGKKYGFDADCVVCGSGETEVISFVIRAFAQQGDPVLMYEPCFPIYHMFAENEGRVPVYVPMGHDFDFVIENYVKTLKEVAPKIAFLTNPHSPSGRFMEERDIRVRLADPDPAEIVAFASEKLKGVSFDTLFVSCTKFPVPGGKAGDGERVSGSAGDHERQLRD